MIIPFKPSDMPEIFIINDKAYKWRWELTARHQIMVHKRLEVEGFYVLDFVDNYIDILRLMVAYDLRGRGIGTKLLDDIILEAKHRKIYTLKMTIWEHDSMDWLLKREFKGDGVLTNYFGEGKDGWVLRRVL